MIDQSQIVNALESVKHDLSDRLAEEDHYTDPDMQGVDRLQAQLLLLKRIQRVVSNLPSMLSNELINKIVQLAAHYDISFERYVVERLEMQVEVDMMGWDREAERIDLAMPEIPAEELRAQREADDERRRHMAEVSARAAVQVDEVEAEEMLRDPDD